MSVTCTSTLRTATTSPTSETRTPCCRRETAQCRCDLRRLRPAAILNLIEPEIASFDPLTRKTLPRTKHQVDQMIRRGDLAIRNRHIMMGAFETRSFREGEVVGGSSIIPLERAMLVSYRLSIVTIALSPKFAIECLRRSIRQGVNFGQNFMVFPLEYIPDVGVRRERIPQAI